VGHPLLESHPSHALAGSCCRAARGGVQLRHQGHRAGQGLHRSLKIFSHLANVGDCRSLVIHPASTTHFRMSDEALAAAGIGQGTIRLSIGLEDPTT
jgi:O-acetylhomoserine (thiol)-lyase